MKFEDESQNLRVRLRIIQVLVILLLVVLAVRLYVLQVANGTYYAERAENQRIRLLPIPAPRGVILDREGKLLVDSRPIYNVILSREDMKGKDFGSLIAPLAAGLAVDQDLLRERFDEVKSQPAFESIRVKENADQADIAWVESHALEFPELRVEPAPQRRYPENGVLAHVLGYVGEISPELLEQPRYKDHGYKPGDIIGREGLEAVYDDYLRGRDGYRKVVVDSRGHIQSEIERVEPQPGQDLVTSIDLDLQMVAEDRLRNSPSKRGVIIAMDPNNGEIRVLASYPTFDPNLFSQRISSKEGRAEYAALKLDPKTPLLNRAIQGRYPPGSTWKIPMAVAGLQQGAITLEHSSLLCGGGITIGNKFTRCMGNHGTPELRVAITRSCDGYFYRLGLKMGIRGIMDMVEEFDLNKRTGVDLPHELVSWTPSPEFKARFNPRDPEWKDIDTVYASFGQVYDIVTPIALLRAVAGIGVGGQLYVPHLLKEAREVSEIGPFAARPARAFDHPAPKLVPIPEDQHRMVVEGMWGVVNNGGTAARIKMAGFEIAGKTGTAQVVGLGKDTGENKDHAWFVSYAPAYKPEIAVLALIENVGFGGTHAAPAVRAVYDEYYRKTRNAEPPGADQLALKR
ncbi:MAG TPA: penicillin-binding protein 2 [Pyrinomonadaceae bacterium]|jgi:penicillin-binding protein 2|nr:penicillin-binding protein 2 [Pyrinomonadaceae bacterium]